MAFFERFNRWRQDAHIRRLTHRIATYYGRAGAVGPYAAAALELYLRRKIEEFRDFASARYLEDPTLTLADIKQEWLTLVVKPMARSEFMHDNAKRCARRSRLFHIEKLSSVQRSFSTRPTYFGRFRPQGRAPFTGDGRSDIKQPPKVARQGV